MVSIYLRSLGRIFGGWVKAKASQSMKVKNATICEVGMGLDVLKIGEGFHILRPISIG